MQVLFALADVVIFCRLLSHDFFAHEEHGRSRREDRQSGHDPAAGFRELAGGTNQGGIVHGHARGSEASLNARSVPESET